MRILGVPRQFAPTGSTDFLLDHFGLTADGHRGRRPGRDRPMPEADLLLAVDQGTELHQGGAGRPPRAIVARVATSALSTSYPQPGWVEQDAKEIWTASGTQCGIALEGIAAVPCRRRLASARSASRSVLWERRPADRSARC